MLGDVEVDWSAAPRLRRPVDAPDRRQDRRPAGVHPAAGPMPLPDVDAGSRRAGRGCRERCAHGFRGQDSRSCTTSRPCSTGCPRADDRAQPAMVVGLPDQPPHRRRLRQGPGVRRRRRRAHPPAHRRAGHEHRHPGRPQPGLEAGAGAGRAGRAGTAWRATTPSAGRSAKRSSGAPCAARAKASARTRPMSTTSCAARRSCSSTTRAARSSARQPRWAARAPDATGPDPRRGDRTAAAVQPAWQARAHHAAVRAGRPRRRRDVRARRRSSRQRRQRPDGRVSDRVAGRGLGSHRCCR